jgi:transcriptional regulator with XRE-family HTH domain
MKLPMQNTFGGRLRWLREFKKLTLRGFGDRIGADPGYLSKLECGKAKVPSKRFAARITAEFRLEFEWLWAGQGSPFVSGKADERTRNALPHWSEDRLQRVVAILDELPEALQAEEVVSFLLRDLTLEQIQDEWSLMMNSIYPTAPVTARLFWNSIYPALQEIAMNEDFRQGLVLTKTASASKSSDVKPKDLWPSLKKKLQVKTEATGRTALADFLGVELSRVSQWLSDSEKTAREPGAEYALLMEYWLNKVAGAK